MTLRYINKIKAISLAGLAIIWVSSCWAQAPGGMMKMPVEVAIAKKETIYEKIKTIGNIQSGEFVTITSELPGKIQSIFFKEGQHVTAGERLIKLDDAILQAEFKSAKAELETDKQEALRTEKLYKAGIVSKKQWEATFDKLQQAEANYSLAQAKLAQTLITAPFSGVIGLRKVSPGEVVNNGTALINLESSNAMQIEFSINEKYLNKVKPGQVITLKVAAYPGEVFKGSIYAIDPTIDKDTHNIMVKATIEDKKQKLHPGYFASVELSAIERAAVMVPEQALMKSLQGTIIYIIEDEKAKMIPITTGFRDSKGNIEVLTGVKEKDKVVIAGQMKIRDGASVSIITH